MNQLARAAIDQRQRGRNGCMGRCAERQHLNKGDAQDHARLGIRGQRLAGSAVDQRVEIGEVAQRLGCDGMDERPVGSGQALRGTMQRQLQRIASAQDRVEQAQGGATGGEAGNIRGSGRFRHRLRLG